MKRVRKFILIGLSLCLLLSFSACSKKEDESTLIVTLDDKKLYYKDFLYDIYVIENQIQAYDTYYKQNLGYEKDYLDVESEGITMRDVAKATVFQRVVMYEILANEGKKAGLTITEKEKATNEANVKTLIDGMSEEALKKTGLTYDLLINAYNKITLGDKFYQELTKDIVIDEEAIKASIDKDAKREYKTEFLYLSTISDFDEDKNPIPLSEEEIEDKYILISKAYDLINEGKTMQEISKEYPEISYNTHDYVYGETTYTSPYQESSKNLDNDTYTDIVQTGYGFLIIHMLDNNSEEAYEEAIKEAIREAENIKFNARYEDLKVHYNIVVNEEYWQSIEIGHLTIDAK